MNMHICPGKDWARIGDLLHGRTASAIQVHYREMTQAEQLRSSVELLEYKNRGKVICKGDTIVLSNMSKSNSQLDNKTAVVKLIVKECGEKRNLIVFMVELLEHQLFPAISRANRRREKAYKQTGYSRYGDQMREHYVMCKFDQIDVKF